MRVALLGTGRMGAGMARSMLREGLEVTVWNRSADKAAPLADDGARVAGSVTEAVGGADVVVTMLYDTDSVLAVADELVAAARPDAVWVQSTTVGTGIDAVAATAGQLAFLDAPVLGTKQPAEQGQLVPLVSGPREALDTVQPVLDAIGARTVYAGPEVGKGSALKLACNSWVATVVVGIAQAQSIAASLGVDPALFLDAVKGGALDAPYVQLKGTAMLTGSYETAFPVDGVAKDVELMLAAVGDAFPDDVLRAIRDALGRASAAGHGGDDMAAVRTAFPG